MPIDSSRIQDLPDDQRHSAQLAMIEARLEALRAGENADPNLDPEMAQGDKNAIADAFEDELSDEERAEGRGLSPEERAAQEQEERKLILAGLGAELQRKAEQRVIARRPVEERWIQDTRQYHAKYDPAVLQKIKEAKGSRVFVNITAPKTDGFSARMADMILPTDGKNWGIKPTPVPEVLSALHDETPIQDGPTGQPFQTPEGNQVQARDVAKGINETLSDRCKDMEREMEDQLDECHFNAAQRKGIDQCAQLGTMVLKGPIIVGKTRRSWEKQQDGTGVVHVLKIIEDKRPAVEWVDVWDFFPDMNSPDSEAWEDVFQRHYFTKRQLRDLAKQPGFDEDAVRQVLKEDRKPYATAQHLQMLRDVTGESATTQLMERFEVWEYHGPVTAEQLAACGCELDESDLDPLQAMDAVLWFCEGTVLKAALNPTEVGGLGYHVTWVKRDETSPFGFGIPRLMRNSQKVANNAWRMVMDNAGLSLAPQIIMAMGVRPADGNWSLYPGKVWIMDGQLADVRAAMTTFDLPIQLKELLSIFETAMKLADEETSMPVIMQGDRSPAVPETAEGMAMLFNAASVIQRRFVRLYDDRITRPIILALYDWNMAYNPNEEIKGDYTVEALGSSALLEKERYSQNVLAALNLCASPLIEPRVDVHGIIEEAFRALRLGEKVKDRKEADAEVQRRQQAAAQAAQQEAQMKRGGGADPNAMLQIKQQELAERAQERQTNYQMHRERLSVELEKLSQTTGLKRDELMTKLGLQKFNTDNENKRFNAELAVKQQVGSGI
jgi:hypothetical protein